MKNELLALSAISIAASTHVQADVIDINAAIVKRIPAATLDRLYQQKTGQKRPASLAVSAIFEGNVAGAGLKFGQIPAMSSSPLVLQQEDVTNCNTEPVVDTLDIESSATNSTNFQNSDQLETSHEVSVSMTYDSPFGVSATAGYSYKQAQVNMNSKGGGDSTTTSWKLSPQVTIAGQKTLTTQFVVTQAKLDNVPYTANFILNGNVKLVFSAGANGFTWVPRRGSALPTQPYAPFQFGYQSGYNVFICRVQKDNNTYIGKTHGDVCYFGLTGGGGGIIGIMPGINTPTYDFLVGDKNAVQLGDPFAKNTFDADGKGMQVCLGNFGNYQIPGYVTADGQCVSNYDQRSPATRNYKVLLDPRVGGVEIEANLNDILSEADRTFNLRGYFNGVQAVKGNLRVGQPQPATDCGLIDTSAQAVAPGSGKFTSASAGSSLKGATAASAMPHASTKQKAKVKRVAPGAPLPESANVQTVLPGK
jgi:hypothetical protein